MKLKYSILILLNTALFAQPALAQQNPGEFKGWDSLRNEVPEWFKDAKFGIYFHWGVYSVPAFHSEWYSRSMYVPGTGPNKHQLAKHGSLKQFGYKDFVPMFKAEQFDAEKWVDLFVRAGAKFAGPVAEHADGFSMWDSKINPWNAKAMGPKQDIVGMMEKAIRKTNLKFITTFHHQWLWGWYPTFDTSVDAGDRKYSSLYGPVVSEAAWKHKADAEKPDSAFSEKWLTKVNEVIDQYRPDMLYFDTRLGHIGENYRKQVALRYLTDQARGKKVLLYKGRDLPESIGVRIYEKSRMNRLGERAWLTEEPVSTYGWCYTEDMQLRSAKDILHGMVDIVSKNGVYMLNICPKADGTIPQDQQEILLAIGGWLNRFGEAVYGTRAWYTYGEGPRKEADEKNENRNKKYFELTYTADDIRYTTKDNNIYAIVLGRPQADRILLKSFNKTLLPQTLNIERVTLPGSTQKLKWQHSNEGLSIDLPTGINAEMAVVLKIETKKK